MFSTLSIRQSILSFKSMYKPVQMMTLKKQQMSQKIVMEVFRIIQILMNNLALMQKWKSKCQLISMMKMIQKNKKVTMSKILSQQVMIRNCLTLNRKLQPATVKVQYHLLQNLKRKIMKTQTKLLQIQNQKPKLLHNVKKL